MKNGLRSVQQPKIHIYPFSGEWILINDLDKNYSQRSFNCVNKALQSARESLKSLRSEHEIVIHSKYDAMPHFRIKQRA